MPVVCYHHVYSFTGKSKGLTVYVKGVHSCLKMLQRSAKV